MRYAQKQEKRAFLDNRTTVLPLSGRVGLPNEASLRSAGRPSCPSRFPRHSKWQHRGIIPVEVANEAVQIFGGYGLSKEYTIEKIFRDARAALIEDGANDSLMITGAHKL